MTEPDKYFIEYLFSKIQETNDDTAAIGKVLYKCEFNRHSYMYSFNQNPKPVDYFIEYHDLFVKLSDRDGLIISRDACTVLDDYFDKKNFLDSEANECLEKLAFNPYEGNGSELLNLRLINNSIIDCRRASVLIKLDTVKEFFYINDNMFDMFKKKYNLINHI